ncbi:MAG: thioesterase family protein [Acidimicrobiia bacterium]|nr:thioesterase family protein [Actinomycetota bacterium]MBL6923934.1 thioesterase family protein [Acidimicrobiia bacterium]MBL6926069.1 thioesterase family protein [Acidimicrobiia bacterium]
MSTVPEPLRVWETVVPSEWIDYNGHLTEGFYGVAFGAASDELLIHLGFGETYRSQHGTFYSVETHIRFLKEVHEGSRISTDTYVLGADEKRLHLHHDLLVDGDSVPVATQEAMLLHVSQPSGGGPPRTSAMVEPVRGNAIAAARAHSALSAPAHSGRGIRTLR